MAFRRCRLRVIAGQTLVADGGMIVKMIYAK
jgi:hypothetical protein